MSISQRITGTIEDWRKLWGEALKSFLVTVLSFGLEVFMNVIGKAFAPKLKPLMDTIEATGKVPPELQPLLSEIKSPKGEVAAMLSTGAGYALVGGAVGKLLDAILLPIAYSVNAATRNLIINPAQVVEWWHRHPELEKDVTDVLAALGFAPEAEKVIKELSWLRLDSGTISRIWLRDKAKYEKLWKDLADQGVDEDRIKIIKELAHIIPPLPDMIRFADFGSFDPAVIEAWREMYDAPGWIREPFSLLGITGEWANKYWFSHWRQPGRYEIGELHRRGIIDDDIVKMTYLTQGFSGYWQPKLLELVKEVPTRVDVRRWWDMRTIDEARMREIYHARGYYDKDLDDYVLWTKVYTAFPDLMARFKNGWITEDDVRSELIAVGMPPTRVEEMIQTKIKPASPERVSKERDLTKAEIVKGVKKGVISEGEGWELLQDMGYDESEAAFILAINVAAIAGSPETYPEFKQLTQLYRKAEGLKAEVPPSDVIEASKALKSAREALSEAQERGLKNEKLAPYLQAVSDAEYRYRQLLIKWEEEKK